MRTIKLINLALIIGLLVYSCETANKIEDEVTAKTNALEALQEYSTVAKQFQDASNSCDDGVISAENNGSSTQLKAGSSEPVITVVPKGNETWPVIITVNFGDGIEGRDGITRKGKLIIESTNWYRVAHSVHATSFENYYQNNNKIEGTHIATNLGLVDGFLNYDVEVKNGKLTTPEGKVILYTQQTTRTWIAGDDTPLYIWDDEYELDGSQTGVSSKGVNYTLQITEPLYFIMLPRSVESGKMDVTVEGLQDIEIDYEASTITIGGVSYPLV